jgi:hypothetical protein
LELLRAHARALSAAAPVAADLLQLKLLRALEGLGEWPPLNLEKGGAKRDSAAITLFLHALTAGRASARTRARPPPPAPPPKEEVQTRARRTSHRPARYDGGHSAEEDDPGVQAGEAGGEAGTFVKELEALGHPPRPPRLTGDAIPLHYQADHQFAVFALCNGADSIHGIPGVLKKNLRAAFLRAAEAQCALAAAGSEGRAFWGQQLRKPGPVVSAMALAIQRVDHFPETKTKKARVVKHSAAVEQALEHPAVKTIVNGHTRALYEGEGEGGRTVDAPDSAHKGAWDAGTEEGTWGRFARFLARHPRHAVQFRHRLLMERERWIAELRELEQTHGIALGPSSGALGACGEDGGLDEVRGGAHPSEAHSDEEAAAAGEEGFDDNYSDDGSDAEGGEEEDEEEEGDDGAQARGGGGGGGGGVKPPKYRGKPWYPKLFGLVPRARAVLRSARYDDAACNQIFGRPLAAVFTDLPALPKGGRFGSSVITTGFSVAVPYKKAGAPAPAAAPRGPPTGAAPAAGGAHVPPARLADSRPVTVDAGKSLIVWCFERVVDAATGAPKERHWTLSTVEWRAARGDDARLATSRHWCRHLAAPGGAFSKLAAVTRKTSSSARFVEYGRVAHGTAAGGPGALYDVLAERCKA